jgi:hypothetical protein
MRYLFILLVFASCNPVKQVLKDPVKFEAVADEMIKRGYCLNDTIYKYSTDTLEVHDTTLVVDIITEVRNDTTYLWETKFQTITKVRTIRDSIKSVVIDSAQVQVLRKQLAAANVIRDAAVKDMKGLRKIIQIGAAACAVFFLLLFKLK